MTKTELEEIIRNGENSGVEFKRDDVHPDRLSLEISALANLQGGRILLGVEDDGNITGLTRTRPEAEEWVMNICRKNIYPPLIPYWECIAWDGTDLGIISIARDFPDKPYRARRAGVWVTYIRVGSTSRTATREEEARLFQAAGLLRYDIRPVPKSSIDDLDRDRLVNYFEIIRHQRYPPLDDNDSWKRLLQNTELMVEHQGRVVATTGALLLFGANPNRFLPQAGITATAYRKTEKGYDRQADETIRGPLAPLLDGKARTTEQGLIDRAISFVQRNMGGTTIERGGRRIPKPDYPEDAIREAIVNAVAHRDYTIAVTDIEVSLYKDRLEVISPGQLPNTVTVDKMKQGYRAARNELLKEILRDYNYIEHRGMGIPYKIIAGMMEHNGTEPNLDVSEDRFIVRLFSTPPAEPAKAT